MKNIGYIVIVVIIIIIGIWFFGQNKEDATPIATPGDTEIPALSVDQIRQNLVGTWRSLDDDKSIATYNDNGTFRALYDGLEQQNGAWEMYTLEGKNGGPSGNFMRTIDSYDTRGDGILEYAIIEATGDALTLSYMGRGNTLRYERVIVEPLDPES